MASALESMELRPYYDRCSQRSILFVANLDLLPLKSS